MNLNLISQCVMVVIVDIITNNIEIKETTCKEKKLHNRKSQWF